MRTQGHRDDARRLVRRAVVLRTTAASGVDEIAAGLERLGESPEVTNPLRQYLRPALATLPMYV